MDWGRRPYTTLARPFSDSEETVPIIWRYAAPGAVAYPHLHAFQSLDWDALAVERTGVGEVYGATRTYNGRGVIPDLTGRRPCGPPEWYLLGQPLDQEPCTERRPDGIPLCCGPASRCPPVTTACTTQLAAPLEEYCPFPARPGVSWWHWEVAVSQRYRLSLIGEASAAGTYELLTGTGCSIATVRMTGEGNDVPIELLFTANESRVWLRYTSTADTTIEMEIGLFAVPIIADCTNSITVEYGPTYRIAYLPGERFPYLEWPDPEPFPVVYELTARGNGSFRTMGWWGGSIPCGDLQTVLAQWIDDGDERVRFAFGGFRGFSVASLPPPFVGAAEITARIRRLP